MASELTVSKVPSVIDCLREKCFSDMDHILAGAFAGVVGTVLGFPLDTIKTRMQTGARGASPTVSGTFLSILRSEGMVKGFYKGIGPPITALTILNSANFTSYAYFRKVLGIDSPEGAPVVDGHAHRERGAFDGRVVLAGMAGGPLGSVVSTPFELLKVQMQMDNVGAQRYRSSFHAVTTIVREHGVRALYVGHAVNTIREMAFLGTYFGIYEHTKAFYVQYLPAAAAVPIAGGLSGAGAWFLSFPLDSIKQNIQGQRLDLSKTGGQLRIRDVATQIWRTRGLQGLYAGVSPSVMRAFLVSGSRFSAYEYAMWILTGQ